MENIYGWVNMNGPKFPSEHVSFRQRCAQHRDTTVTPKQRCSDVVCPVAMYSVSTGCRIERL